jgi:predicted DNA-binding transcriptional regulator AlpA
VLPDPTERPVISAEEVFRELGIDRTAGYRSIRDGTFPVEVVHVGRIIRVPTIALRQLLHLDGAERHNVLSLLVHSVVAPGPVSTRGARLIVLTDLVGIRSADIARPRAGPEATIRRRRRGPERYCRQAPRWHDA